jgi:hypothetical protein
VGATEACPTLPGGLLRGGDLALVPGAHEEEGRLQ